jgi:hypothetical protein
MANFFPWITENELKKKVEKSGGDGLETIEKPSISSFMPPRMTYVLVKPNLIVIPPF